MVEEELAARLRAFDSASVANAIEGLGVRDPTEGFSDLSLKAIKAGPEPMVGYAVTFKVDATTPGLKRDDDEAQRLRAELFEAVEKSPKPVVICIEEAGPNPERATHMGDIFGIALARAGVVGIVTGSGVRDIAALGAESLWMFARGRVVARGVYTMTEVNVPVKIAGLHVTPRDLLHGSEDGIVVVPTDAPERLLESIEEDVAKETANWLAYVRQQLSDELFKCDE